MIIQPQWNFIEKSLEHHVSRFFWPNIGLGRKMAIIAAIGVISLVGLFAFLGISALQENTDRTLQERVALAQTMASRIDYVLANIDHALTTAATQEELVDPTQREDALKAVAHRLALFGDQVYLLDNKGRILMTQPPSAPSLSLDHATPVVSVLKGERFSISSTIDAHNPQPSVLAAAPIRNAAGEVIGLLALTIDLNGSNIGVLANSPALGETSYADLVDANGVILSSSRSDRVSKFGDHSGNLIRMIQDHRPLVTTCHDCHVSSWGLDRQREVLAFAPLYRAQWGVAVHQGEAEAFAPRHQLLSKIFTLGAMALLGVLGLVYVTTRMVITPVQALTTATRRIASGDLKTPLEVHGRDEIGTLTRSFDEMRLRLKTSMEESQAWNRELDRRVQERTAACVAAQEEAQRSRDQLQTVMDSLSDELMVIDRDYRVRQVNARLSRHLDDGCAAIGKSCYEIAHGSTPCQSADCPCPLPIVVETGRPVRVTHFHPQEGSGRYLDIVASPLIDEGGRVNGIVEVWRDVTQERRLEETLLARNRDLSALNTIARTVIQSRNLEECLDIVLAEVMRISGVDVGVIFLVEGEDHTLKLRAFRGLSKEAAMVVTRVGLSDSGCAGVLDTGKPVIVSNVPHYQTTAGTALQRENLRSLAHIPLIAKGQRLGSMCVGTRVLHEFSTEEIALLTSIADQIAIAVENAQLYEELQRKEQVRGALLRAVISAQEEERKRISRELHDETSQTLSALLYTLDTAREAGSSSEMQPLLQRMRELTIHTIDEIHKIIFDLRPTMLDQLGLTAALRWYAETRLGELGVRLKVQKARDVPRLSPVVETAIFRTVQEAINNITKHSGARHATIRFARKSNALEIVVKDDGIGFDVDSIARSADPKCGWGLMGMQERISAIGGELYITSMPGNGTEIRICVSLGGDDG
ncbi:MAG: GAF domain-containing protein [Chloroflexi bacterium]|nr:GAF domain-containing protein [Chloroflexota bacterium]